MKATNDAKWPADLNVVLPAPAVTLAARWWPLVVVVGLALLWAKTVHTVYVNEGAFVWLGVDFRAYYTQALALIQGLPGEIYNLDLATENTRMFAEYSHVPWPMTPAPVPYPPVFVGLFAPFATLSPLSAFALWSAVNLLAATHVARRIAARFPGQTGRWAAILFMISFPLGYAVFLGQPMAFLAVAVAELFLAFEQGQELTAGLWLGVLLIKPQYGLLIGPMLLWKGRWRAVAGVTVTALLILVGSYVVGGLPSLLAYPRSMLDEQLVAGTTLVSYPQDMTNWRMVFFLSERVLGPWLSDGVAFALTMLCSALTAAVVFVAWRGPWNTRDRGFAARMTLLFLGTVLVNYHSHAYGPVLAALPAAVLLARSGRNLPLQVAILAAVILPTCLMLVLRAWFLPIFAVQIGVLFGLVAWECEQVRSAVTVLRSRPLAVQAVAGAGHVLVRPGGNGVQSRA